MTIRLGIIGCGKVAHLHVQALAGLAGVTLTAASNRGLEHLNEFCEAYKVKGYQDYRQMLASEKLDGVIVATPHPSHCEIVLDCAKAHCHVLVEKPLCLTSAEGLKMQAACSEAGVLLGLIVQRRFYKPCMRIKKALDAGLLGRPILAEVVMLGSRDEAYYRSDPWRGTWQGEGGGVIVTQASHQIDLLNWYLGEIDTIYGLSANFNHPYIEVEDSAAAVVRYKNGALATLLLSNSQDPALYGKVHVFGSNGSSVGVQTDGGQMFIAGMSEIEEPPVADLWQVQDDARALSELVKEDEAFFKSVDKMTYFHQRVFENFARAIKGEEKLLASGLDGIRTAQIFEAIYKISEDPKLVWHQGRLV